MKKFPSVITFILLIIATWYSFYSSMPQKITGLNTSEKEFATHRALEHVRNISKQPHYLGSTAHSDVKNYIKNELEKLGLNPQIQEGFSIYKEGSISKPQNIIAKIKGSSDNKALLVLSHYDSSPHSSYGASDAGSGVATILEGIRAYLAQNKIPKNDIIICISDGEELGLNGAQLFVSEHPWAKNIGLVLNFEARGSGGNSFMLVETKSKNGKMIEEFINANPKYPVTNSLAYSIYKMLPNDTDLTIFRELGNIEGFNFAFIDDHFDYHTSNDTWQNLDLNTLQHQGSYLMPLLSYFSESDLSNLKSEVDYIYFNIPLFHMIKYPFSWIYPLLGIGILLFIFLVFYGRVKHRIDFGEVGKGFLAFFLSLALAGGFSYLGWLFIKFLYPDYGEMLHGFTYNGYVYICVFILFGLAISFKIYSKFKTPNNLPSLLVAPLFFWLVICTLAAIYLEGASYFIIPVLFAQAALFITIRQKLPNGFLMVLLCLPSIFILSPFIASFPVALGLNILFVSSILTVLLFGLLLPVLGFYQKKGLLGNIFIFLTVLFFIIAHFKSDFTQKHPKPNSLVYILDTEKNQAFWATYDKTLDPWTSNYIDPKKNQKTDNNTLESKYSNRFTYKNTAVIKDIPSSEVITTFDTIQKDFRYVELCYTPKRDINRLDIFLDKSFNFKSLQCNGVTTTDIEYKDGKIYNAFTKRRENRLLTYFARDNEPLELKMKFPKDSVPEFIVYESSYNLLENDLFSVPERATHMMPKPFIINDAIIVKKKIRLEYKEKVVDTTIVSNEAFKNIENTDE